MATTQSGALTPRRILLYVGIVVALAAVLYAAFFLGDEAGPAVAEVAGEPEAVEGEPLPPFENPADDPAVGQPAPVFSGADFDGEPVTVGDSDVEMIVTLASWCPACQEEVPELVEWLEAGELPDGVELTAIATFLDDARPNWPPQDWLEREDFDEPVIVDDEDSTIASAYGMTSTPSWIFVRDGVIQGRHAGQVPMDQLSQVAEQLAGE